jgi:hypothetical protein
MDLYLLLTPELLNPRLCSPGLEEKTQPDGIYLTDSFP